MNGSKALEVNVDNRNGGGIQSRMIATHCQALEFCQTILAIKWDVIDNQTLSKHEHTFVNV